MSLRVLYLGENWYGSCARACCYSLRRLGCDVRDVDLQTFFPQLQRRSLRLLVRVLNRQLVQEYNDRILHWVKHFRPEVLLACKGYFVLPATLRTARQSGAVLYNYYPDRMIFARGTMLEHSIPEYDCLFDTKTYWDGDTGRRIRPKRRVFIAHGYDPELHSIPTIADSDAAQFRSDALFVGTHTFYKEEVLAELKIRIPKLRLKIWGNLWERATARELKDSIVASAVEGRSYAKAIRLAKINLAIMGVNPGAKDETTMRTYEIPACGGFMLHERTPELMGLFDEGREVACFGSAEELTEKVDYYLAHPEERERIATAGHRRCVPAYSYDERMRQLLAFHAGRTDMGEDCTAGATAYSSLCS